MSKPKRAGIYLRVSTQDQSTDMQLADIQEFAKLRGWNVVDIYEDKATGTNAQRPQLKRLMQDARARKIDIIVAWKLDRFFRSLRDLVLTLEEIESLGIQFVSLKDQIDLTTPAGRLLMQIIGAMAEFEAALIQERVRAGLAEAKAKGIQLGRPSKGVDRKQVLSLRQQGKTFRQIAELLGVSPGTIHALTGVQKT
ncbi:MAG: recombinase family protein [Oligoflexia bacterium]|nr:recombinase family protein [Oligoflexia bacterium]